jgi:hypothetical protein
MASTGTPSAFDPAAVGFPGGVPAFPGTESLSPDAFKVVVASWRRINPAITSTGDFAVDVSTYAPRGPFVKRVQLVDAQVPNTQTLIEPPWCRLWMSMGIPVSSIFRRVDAEFQDGRTGNAMIVSAVFPLPVSQVLSATVIRPGVTRLVFGEAAPSPAPAIVAAWTKDNGYVVLAGVPTLVSASSLGLVLTREMVQSPGIPNAMDILDNGLAAAVGAGAAEPGCMALIASRIPNDSALARAVSWGLTMAIHSSGISPGPVRCVVAVSYCADPQEDRFKLQLAGPPHCSLQFSPGAVTTYMGLDGLPLLTGAPAVRAPAPRVQPPCSFARLPWSNYATTRALADAVAAASSTYTWPAFDIGIILPGAAPATASVPGGHATLAELAVVVQAALTVVTPLAFGMLVTPSSAQDDDCPAEGLVFSSDSGVQFRVQLPLVPALGYTPGYLTPWGSTHMPNDVAGPHIPLSCGDLPFPANVDASINGAGNLVLRASPFAPFPVTVTPAACSASWVATPTQALFLPGLTPGALVNLVQADLSAHVVCVVTDGAPLTLLQLDATVPFVPTDDILVVPMDAPPITVYMQTASASVDRLAPVPAGLFGFGPDTYVARPLAPSPLGALVPEYSLVSPGTMRVRADPFLLLCLSFYASDANVLTGDVYYPLETPSGGFQLVFAQVLRCGAEFRSDYDRVFYHCFPGAGTHLGYIRVKILNADGTPYQTHGHPVSVCLRMDVMTDSISLGGPAHMSQLPLADESRAGPLFF